jgi:signal transduction histidine kinase
MAHRQALLATRLQAGIMAGAAAQPVSRDLERLADAYVATVVAEQRIIATDADSQAEQARELALARALAAHARPTASPADLRSAVVLASQIANDELAEARQADAASDAAWRELWRWLWLLGGSLCAIMLLGGALVWHALVVPLRGLAAASLAMAHETTPPALTERGPREVRALVGAFNTMAVAVDAQVARRTADLAAANRQLREADSRLRLFMAKVGHELRTPLTAIRGEAELAQRLGGNASAMADALSRITDSASFLGRRLDDLAALARAQAGALPLQIAAVDLADVANEVVRRTASYARTSGVELAPAAVVPAPVHGDFDRLYQAIAAVMDNAIKFSPPGGRVSLQVEHAGNEVMVAVTDEGPGIAAGEQERIFDAHVQGAAGRSLGGSGLGLALARWIVQAHGGAITAHSQSASDGLCVTIRLPVNR